MFGHLELNVRDFSKYQCSLCHALSEDYGQTARFFTNDDMALCLWLAINATERRIKAGKKTCILLYRQEIFDTNHPLLHYLAAQTVLLVAEKIKDDIADNGKRLPQKVLAWVGRKRIKAESILNAMGVSPRIVKQSFEMQRALEKTEVDLLRLAEPTVIVMSEIYSSAAIVGGFPDFKSSFSTIGSALGQIIYFIDSVVDYKNDFLTNTFNPLSKCSDSFAKIKGERTKIPDDMQDMVSNIFKAASVSIDRALDGLPKNREVNEVLMVEIRKRIETVIQSVIATSEQSVEESFFAKIRKLSPLSFLSSPGIASASNGNGNSGGCYESIAFLLIMLIAYSFICRGCCGRSCSSHPNTVTVDHGCGGRKTYKRDSCTGRYRDDSCC